MDQLDADILAMLQKNARIQLSEISRHIHLTIPAVSERIKKLEAKGIIEKYTIKLNHEKMNDKLLAFIFVNIERTEDIEGFRRAVRLLDNVLTCHHLAGEYDYLLKVICRDTKDLETFISSQLKKIKGVRKTNTIIALSSIKEEM
ncbi:Lrp/AsnC family transcriptional regulator [Sporolactobacillus sp. KGMB 08714]|uniref:Lrp/AsnC family transcriptional regulator n=1 Tax=Sporolactobacillus sp. KGMB 08714 TaxID=3064704 RepID=UPI002FBE17AA